MSKRSCIESETATLITISYHETSAAVLLNLVWLLILRNAISAVELINTSACLSGFLLSSIERMTLRADLNMDILLRRACYELIPAVAYNLGLIILWMDSFAHLLHLFQL